MDKMFYLKKRDSENNIMKGNFVVCDEIGLFGYKGGKIPSAFIYEGIIWNDYGHILNIDKQEIQYKFVESGEFETKEWV